MPDESTPLLGGSNGTYDYRELDWNSDPHAQFCMLVGVPPSQLVGDNNPRIRTSSRAVPRKSLYGRATRQLASQRLSYYMTASLSNVLLLSQVVLGAALTALGASESSHVLITLFGAANTIIAGLVAYLKSRGQPMRARMFLDDLERVVGEIENSEVMWLGITHSADGYDDIVNADDRQVTVRSEVARLTRLYDRAVNNNSVNNPDMYMAGASEGSNTASRSRLQPGAQPAPVPLPAPAAPQPAATPAVDPAVTPAAPPPAVPPVVVDPDESPMTAVPKPPAAKKVESKDDDSSDSDDSEDTDKDKDKDKDKEKSMKKAKNEVEDKNAESGSVSGSSHGKGEGRDGEDRDERGDDGTSAGLKATTSSCDSAAPPSRDPDALPAPDGNPSLRNSGNSNNGGKSSSRSVNGES